MESKIVTNHKNYHQMALCMFDKAEYCFDSVTLPLLYKGLKNRYYHYTLGIEDASLFNTPEKSYIFSDISEYLFLKYANPQEIPHIEQARVSYLVENPLNLFHKDSRLLQSLDTGRAYLLGKNYHHKNGVVWDEFFLQYFVLNYQYPRASEEIKLYAHASW